MVERMFFAEDRKSANERIKKLAEGEGGFYKGKVAVLAKEQIKHSSGWKTWTYKKL